MAKHSIPEDKARKKEKITPDLYDNTGNEGYGRDFHKGEEPDTYGEDGAENYGGDEVDFGNIVGGASQPNEDRNRIMDKKVATPREPVLNAVPMPNNTKMNKRDYSVLKVQGDAHGEPCVAMASVPVGGVSKPNKIR